MAPNEPHQPGAPGGEWREEFPLAGSQMLVIRPTTDDDAAALESLYGHLSPDDLRRRFFTAGTPSSVWARSWATVSERGGFGVLAIVDDGAGSETTVGEAGYAVRTDGDGDLAVTVDHDWRGWLGAYLVDRLCEYAAAHGIENLQADVLLENSAMLRILEHRGAVAIEHEGGTEHLSIATAGHVPSWPPSDERRRVLVEAAGGRWGGETEARTAGLAVAMCPGPARRRRLGCPVLDGGRCPLADGADAIVVLLDPDDDVTPRIIDAHAEHNPTTPVFIRRNDRPPDTCRVLSGEHERDLSAILQAAARPTEVVRDE